MSQKHQSQQTFARAILPIEGADFRCRWIFWEVGTIGRKHRASTVKLWTGSVGPKSIHRHARQNDVPFAADSDEDIQEVTLVDSKW